MASVVRTGSRIEYEVTGAGPPLVLLHGFFGDRSTWHAAGHAGALAGQFRLIPIDLVGHAGSDTSLLLAGERDPRLRLIRIPGDRLSGAEVTLLPGCGHFDTFTRTDLTVPPAREFPGRLRA